LVILFSGRFPFFLVAFFLKALLLVSSSFEPEVLTVSVVCSLIPKLLWLLMRAATVADSSLLFFESVLRLTFFFPVDSLVDLASGALVCSGKVLL